MGDDGHFGAEVAARYDADSAQAYAPEALDPAVDVLAELAAGGPALELAIGTGRVALPLIERGVDVTGIELSQAMVDQLRAKPGGADVDVTIGDMATTRVDGTFGLVYLVFNTLGNLTTQDAQVDCFANAAAHLRPGGRFVVEIGVPDPHARFDVFDGRPQERWGVDEYELVGQRMWSHHMWVDDGRWRHASIPFRYVWPEELDLMARLAGMRLEHRWEDFGRRPFTNDSRKHVSVWKTDG